MYRFVSVYQLLGNSKTKRITKEPKTKRSHNPNVVKVGIKQKSKQVRTYQLLSRIIQMGTICRISQNKSRCVQIGPNWSKSV